MDDQHFADALCDISIAKDAVLNKLKALKVNKSPDPDGHDPLALNELANELAEPLADVRPYLRKVYLTHGRMPM